MSLANVEIVQQVVAAAQRGDWPAAIAAYDSNIELDVSRMLDGGVSHGHEGVRAYFRRWFGTWEDLEITPERFIDVDDNGVLVLLTFTGRGKGSGARVSMSTGDVFTLGHGKIVQMTSYLDRSDALQAVGLAE